MMNKFKILGLFCCSTFAFAQSNDSSNVSATESFKVIEDSLQTFKIKGEILFEKSSTIILEPNDKKNKIYFRFVSENTELKISDFKIYKKPLILTSSGYVEAYSKNKANTKSLIKFNVHNKPNPWTVESVSPATIPYNLCTPIRMIDGQYGSAQNLEDGWLGFSSPTAEIMVDRRITEELTSLSVNFLQYPEKGIFLPSKVEFYLSNNRQKFIKIGTVEHNTNLKDNLITTKKYELEILPTTARFLKIVAYNYGKLPKNHPSKMTTSYLLMDEINSK